MLFFICTFSDYENILSVNSNIEIYEYLKKVVTRNSNTKVKIRIFD